MKGALNYLDDKLEEEIAKIETLRKETQEKQEKDKDDETEEIIFGD